MLYMAILSFGHNEVAPVNVIEHLFVILILITSSLLLNIVFGDIVSLLYEVNERAREE